MHGVDEEFYNTRVSLSTFAFEQQRSIWLPRPFVLISVIAAGVLAGAGVTFHQQSLAVSFAAAAAVAEGGLVVTRRCEDAALHLDDETRDDRASTPVRVIPGLAACALLLLTLHLWWWWKAVFLGA